MLVSFDFECMKCGIFEVLFDTQDFPDRVFPKEVNCDCGRIADQIWTRVNMQSDNFWAGKDINSLGLKNVTSKSWLKKYLKNNNIAQLTSDEIGHHVSRKSTNERSKEYLNSDKICKERREIIAKSINEVMG